MSDKNKNGFCYRLFKFVALCVVCLLGFSILLVATLPMWISPVATRVAEKVVPGFTGTGFHVERFYVNPYSGILGIKGVRLSNPEGFGEAAALSLTSFNAEVSVKSLFSDVVIVKDVAIDDAFASYYSHNGKNNFDIILANVKKAKGQKTKDENDASAEKKTDSAQKKVIIERLRIAGTKVKLMKSDMMPPFMLPTVELTDVGKKSNGATLEEAWTQIANSVMKSMAEIGDGVGLLGGLLGDGAKDISAMLNKGVIGDSAKTTTDAVGDTSKKAVEGVKNLFKGFRK